MAARGFRRLHGWIDVTAPRAEPLSAVGRGLAQTEPEGNQPDGERAKGKSQVRFSKRLLASVFAAMSLTVAGFAPAAMSRPPDNRPPDKHHHHGHGGNQQQQQEQEQEQSQEQSQCILVIGLLQPAEC